MSVPDVPGPLRQRIREAARDRCGYCLSSQRYVMSKLEIEHLIPRALGGRSRAACVIATRDPKRRELIQ
jgi:5-methylcytosine-specific restriction endonuclease McrA